MSIYKIETPFINDHKGVAYFTDSVEAMDFEHRINELSRSLAGEGEDYDTCSVVCYDKFETSEEALNYFQFNEEGE